MDELEKKNYLGRIRLLVQQPHPDHISLSNAVRKLKAYEADVLITYGWLATEIAVLEKTGIPIIYTCVYEPCEFSAKNITGVCSKTSISSLLRYLKSLKDINRLGVIYDSTEADSKKQMNDIARLSLNYNFTVQEINMKKTKDITKIFDNIRLDAIFITSSSSANSKFSYLINLARNYKIPSASLLYDKTIYATIVLSPSVSELGEKTAKKVIDFLNGISVDRMKVETARETELIFNLKEARHMNFKIPLDLITEATWLIQ
jgi:putative ABC transport system substrate-binding protein